MLYNILTKKVINLIDCNSCDKFDKKLKKCNGLNERCFEFDTKTKTIIDGVTKMPVNLKGE